MKLSRPSKTAPFRIAQPHAASANGIMKAAWFKKHYEGNAHVYTRGPQIVRFSKSDVGGVWRFIKSIAA